MQLDTRIGLHHPLAVSAARIMRVALTCALTLAAVLPVRAAYAQCPDGTPAPCGKAARPDSNVFLVLPFSVSGPREFEYLAESMMDLMRMALDSRGSIRVAYSANAVRRIGQLANRTDPRSASGVARTLGAGRLISGSVVIAGTELRVQVEVFDTEKSARQFPVNSRGDLAHVASMMDSVASAILTKRFVPTAQRARRGATDYSTTSPEALIALVIGEQEQRRGNRRVAADSLKSAVRLDPDFGLAHYRLWALEAADRPNGPWAADLLDDALARIEKFPSRLQQLFEVAKLRRQGERVKAIARVDQLAADYPDDAETAVARANGHLDYGLNLGESRASVLRMFERAMALDDGDPELLSHYRLLLAEAGDTAKFGVIQRRCAVVAPAACGGSDGVGALLGGARPWAERRAADDFIGFPDLSSLRLFPNDLGRAFAIVDSSAMVRAGAQQQRRSRYAAYIERFTLALARGQYGAAWAFLDSAQTHAQGPNPYVGQLTLYNLITNQRRTEVEAVINPRPTGPAPIVGKFVRAWYASERWPVDSAERALAELQAAKPPFEFMGPATVLGLRGMRAFAAGDTARARELFARARTNTVGHGGPNRIFYPSPGFSLALARIDFARGNAAAAKIALADIYPPWDAMMFVAPAEELKARVHEALGDIAAAKIALGNFIGLWDKADPELQPRVAAARAALARLNGR